MGAIERGLVMGLNNYEVQDIIEKLQKGETLPDDYKYKLFPTKQKEYELVYGGKMRKEDILANEDGVFPVPLQVDKVFNGEREGFADGWRNMIVFGDNLQFLKTIYQDEDQLIKRRVKGQVKLIYIDPPFATISDFKSNGGDKAYTDKIKGAEFIEFLRRRLIIGREILADDGNIILHLDNKRSHYAKILLDEIFGEGNYINEIIWHKGREGGSSRSHSPSSSMPTEYQNILIYSKNRKDRFWNPILGPYKESTIKNIKKDEVGWYYTRGRMGRNPAKWELEAGVGLKSYVLKDPQKSKEEVIRQITNIGAEFVAVGDVWNNEMIKFSQITNYPTEKPEDLLKYFIEASTRKGDIVLDFFGGSGTTAAVAEKLGRRWIVCDIGKLAYYTMQKRILNIDDTKSLEQKNKKYGKPACSFVTVNTGKYDLEKVINLEQRQYKDFVLNLFEANTIELKIKGFNIDGCRKDGGYCHVFPYWKHKNTSIDEQYIENIHAIIGEQAGDKFYIIAPATKVSMFEDYLDIGETRYYLLKVPYHVINELHKEKFKSFRQPQSKNGINALDNAVGFHFMRQPKVKSIMNINGDDVCIKITEFKSEFVEDAMDAPLENFQSFAMVIIDLDFDGKCFAMDHAYFAEDLLPNKHKRKKVISNEDDIDIAAEIKSVLELSLPELKKADCGNIIALVYVDIFGNEFKETLTVN